MLTCAHECLVLVKRYEFLVGKSAVEDEYTVIVVSIHCAHISQDVWSGIIDMYQNMS